MNIQVGFRDMCTVACGNLMSVQTGRPPIYPNPSFSEDRLINDAKNLVRPKRELKFKKTKIKKQNKNNVLTRQQENNTTLVSVTASINFHNAVSG